ncbi:tripartite motif-containing protein 35-like [Denticeps clupeoides]|uniref:Uncharacterized protein n=1 Tax=Denticeps clupeoides TaxID=299321 RepID=A0AAY4B2W8_9TELE|nr:tripartite motif-containing protein 35-like [Denticeps clupeoides]
MALRSSLSEEDLSCPICYEVFSDPVLLSCAHSMCRACLERFWRERVTRECPICRRRSSRSDPPSNLVLKNLCEAVLQQRSQAESSESDLCRLHGEKLKLFCLDDEELACVVCRDSRTHTGHHFRPVEEAAVDLKGKLQTKLKPLEEKLRKYEDLQTSCYRAAEHIKRQTHHTERVIKEEFRRLQNFLQDEEEARISALREEEQQKSQAILKQIGDLSTAISLLSDVIKHAHMEMAAGNLSYLQSYKATVNSAQCPPQDPRRVSGGLINQPEHLGNLAFRVWEKMQTIVQYSPVTLDPNTAPPCVWISDDLTCLSYREEVQQVPDNTERFECYQCVLGSEGFDSGTHSWDVEVKDSGHWYVGVALESIQRKGDPLTINTYWGFGCYDGKFSADSFLGPRFLILQKLERIRVKLDCDRGTVAFIDPAHSKQLYQFKTRFSERVYPYFWNADGAHPLRILPEKISVTISEL